MARAERMRRVGSGACTAAGDAAAAHGIRDNDTTQRREIEDAPMDQPGEGEGAVLLLLLRALLRRGVCRSWSLISPGDAAAISLLPVTLPGQEKSGFGMGLRHPRVATTEDQQ